MVCWVVFHASAIFGKNYKSFVHMPQLIKNMLNLRCRMHRLNSIRNIFKLQYSSVKFRKKSLSAVN